MNAGKFTQTNSSFSLGVVSQDFSGRGDLKTAAHGLSKLENMDIISSGGISRRAGTRVLAANLPDDAKIIPMRLRSGDEYIIAFGDRTMRVYKDGVQQTSRTSPWSSAQLPNIQTAQLGDMMILTHPDTHPHRLLLNMVWLFGPLSFAIVDNWYREPYFKFENSNYPFTLQNITVPGATRQALLTATHDNWTPESVGSRMRFGNIEWWISEYVSPTQVKVFSNSASPAMPTGTVTDWSESVFSDRRGWPKSIALHQNRLVFGGTKSFPNFVWMSRTGDHMNFDAGTGLDNQAVILSLLAGRPQSITSIQSGENLEVLTDMGEWSIKGAPITPSEALIRQHTDIGSSMDIHVPPSRVDGATIFIGRTGNELRELRLDNLSDSYSATDLSTLSRDIMGTATGMTYHQETKRLLIVMQDGTMAVLKKDDNLEILGWSTYKTDGEFKSVAVSKGQVLAAVKRGSETFMEIFDENKMTDGGANFAFEHKASAMPIFADSAKARLAKVTKWKARLKDAGALSVKINGNAAEVIPLPETPFTGDVSVNSLGTTPNGQSPLWEIIGSEPQPLTVLSITIEGRLST
ncbi:MAG: hypothetical protein FWD33_02420 [Alphaproteobacteria bacterium]|nr:hypothetical protein [Alphaproteobacteria bacterium]